MNTSGPSLNAIKPICNGFELLRNQLINHIMLSYPITCRLLTWESLPSLPSLPYATGCTTFLHYSMLCSCTLLLYLKARGIKNVESKVGGARVAHLYREHAHIYRGLLLNAAAAGSPATCGPLLHVVPPFHVLNCAVKIKAQNAPKNNL